MVKIMMKKRYLGMLFVALLALVIPTLVIASEPEEDKKQNNDAFFPESDEEKENDQVIESLSENDGKGLRVIGKWGHGKDEDPDGYFAARITQRGRVGLLKGVYNLTGEEEKTRIIGIMKKGYFNGRIITDDGEVKLTGFYRVDKEQHLLKMQWMTPGHAGWAVGRLSVFEN